LDRGWVIVVDAANVIGSRPTGWWKDRAGAARSFVEGLRAAARAGRLTGPVVVVLEGKAREGVSSGTADGVTVVHAEASGDDALVDVVRGVSAEDEEAVVLVTADRELRRRVEALGAEVVGPKWLLERLD
jgi:predicted ribonuclease YlaK